jgi:hypothetical protein
LCRVTLNIVCCLNCVCNIFTKLDLAVEWLCLRTPFHARGIAGSKSWFGCISCFPPSINPVNCWNITPNEATTAYFRLLPNFWSVISSAVHPALTRCTLICRLHSRSQK